MKQIIKPVLWPATPWWPGYACGVQRHPPEKFGQIKGSQNFNPQSGKINSIFHRKPAGKSDFTIA
jgi:hypothetical protein